MDVKTGNKRFYASSAAAFPTNQNIWDHLVINFYGPEEGEGIEGFKNGVSYARGDTSGSPGANPLADSARKIFIGSITTDGAQQVGSLEADEVIFFNKALTPEEITSLYNQHK